MTLPDARARVERLRDAIRRYDEIRAEFADADALSRVLAELDRLPRLREALDAMLAALSSPETDEGLCVAHGEEIDLCDACLYDRQKRMRTAADNARALTAALETPTP